MKRLGLGDWGRGGGRTNRRPSGFPNNKAKTAHAETALVAKCPIIAFSNRIFFDLTANLNQYRYNKLNYCINLLFLFVYMPRKSGFLS
jgi:hypothetical protein